MITAAITETEVPRPAKLAHVVLRSARFDETVAWWKTVLGAHAVHSNEALTFLTYDDEHHRIAIVRNPTLGDDGRSHAGLEHVAFTYASLHDLVATYERLRDAGITPILPINHGMTLSLYYQDPDGNQAELQIDLVTPVQAEAFMASDTFAANPLGVPFDPEEMAAQHRAGMPVTALRLYGPAA
jgi:catechol-2,3-dioxygenase